MSTWHRIDDPEHPAPKDGTEIQARIPGHGSDNVIAWISGYYNGEDKTCAGRYS